jgi:formate-dependent nitrite reductase membrane component NrfD
VNIATPWMLVTGCVLVGWVVPEFLAAIGKREAPTGLNVLCAVAGGLIAGAFVA